MAEEISNKHKETPDGLYQEPGLATAITWDNYDELTAQIVAGLQTTHDTMGIVKQNKKIKGEHSTPHFSINCPKLA